MSRKPAAEQGFLSGARDRVAVPFPEPGTGHGPSGQVRRGRASGEVGGVGAVEQGVCLVVPGPVLDRQGGRELAGRSSRAPVGPEAGEAQVAEARLARAEQLPLAPQLEVPLGELEPVGRLDERLEPRLRGVGQLELRPRDRAGSRTARRRGRRGPRSWWSCASPNRSASCTIMIVAFGTSTPTSITVVATSTSSSPVLERPHHLAPLGRLQPPVQQADPVAGELGAPQALRLLLGRARQAGLGRLDQRADDVGLPARVEVDAEPLVGLARPLRARPRR